MLDIDIRYKPFKLLLWFRYLKVKLPIHWRELTQKQFIAIPYLQRGLLDDFKILQIFLGIKRNVAKRIDSGRSAYIKSYLKFIEEPEPLDYFVIKKAMWFKAPGPQLKDVPFLAFTLGLTYYQNYLKGEKHDLDRFIACFYYKKLVFFDYDKKGFDYKLIEYNAIMIRCERVATREAIVINFGLIYEWLGRSYPYAFHESAEILKLSKSLSQADVLNEMINDFKVEIENPAKQPAVEVLKAINEKVKEYYKDNGGGHPLSEDF